MMVESEDWKIIFKVYKEHPTEALDLAVYLTVIKQRLKRGRKGKAKAIELLNEAIETLFPHTDFCKVGHKFYRKRVKGDLTFKQEQRLRKLGVKI